MVHDIRPPKKSSALVTSSASAAAGRLSAGQIFWLQAMTFMPNAAAQSSRPGRPNVSRDPTHPQGLLHVDFRGPIEVLPARLLGSSCFSSDEMTGAGQDQGPRSIRSSPSICKPVCWRLRWPRSLAAATSNGDVAVGPLKR